MKTPRISILVATADRPALLAGCLESLSATRFAEAEVLVLDQSETEPRVPAMNGDGPFVRLVRCPRRGKSAALNLGVREARGPWLAFTDDDCRVAVDWLRVIDRTSAESGMGCVLTGRVVAGRPEETAVTAPSLRESDQETTYRTPGFRDVLFGNNMAIPAGLLRSMGCFDEALGPGTAAPAAEDNDLGSRLLRAGMPIRYQPRMVVTHRSWRSGPAQVRLFHGYGVGQGAFYAKHVRQGDLHMAVRLARNIWDTGRDLGGAILLRRSQDVQATRAFAGGLVRGFLRSIWSGNGGRTGDATLTGAA